MTYEEKGFSEESIKALDELYSTQDTTSIQGKFDALARAVGSKVFASYGGNESEETELAAMEFEYLLSQGLEESALA